ncbi:MAG: DUF3347 domain-containing protein [Sphingobacteriaceae bacterium]|nr:MAG: DUF3347 domain-containing protein [Sphingobacteriaceae bacterium]
MRKIFIAAACAAMFLASACNQNAAKKEDTSLTDTAAQAKADLPDSQNVSKVLTSYIALKNELVKSDAEAGKKAAATLEDELIAVKGCAEAASMARAIAASGDIDEQRKAFLTLSKDIIPLAKGIKTGDTMYVTHCPMANDGKGGDWLSEVKEIKNPYFGDTMLECGAVKEVLK